MTIDPREFGSDRETVQLVLESENIEARPVWKPMHRQPIFKDYEAVMTGVADGIFEQGLCLPSSSSLTVDEIGLVVDIVRGLKIKSRKGHRRTDTKAQCQGSAKES